MNDLLDSAELTFHVHLFRISNSPLNPTVRILLVAASNFEVIYEGIGAWSEYSNWLGQLLNDDGRKREVNSTAKRLRRSKYAALCDLRISLYDLESLGLNRVDKLL
jgi:hypothetical protein